jgi:hypothetical protein
VFSSYVTVNGKTFHFSEVFSQFILVLLIALSALALGLMYRRTLRDWIDRKFFMEACNQDRILRELIDEVDSSSTGSPIS